MQPGFRSKHSTVTASLKVSDDIKAALDEKYFCVALFIDLAKAFETVDHHILSNVKLVSRFGHNAICWFQSYLTDRTQCVRLGSTVSDPGN